MEIKSDADVLSALAGSLVVDDEPAQPVAQEPAAPQQEPQREEQEQAEPGEQQEQQEPEEFEYEFNGEKYVLPKALKPLTEAQMRQSDYTRKTQEVAEHRRILDEQAKLLNAAQAFQQAAQKEFSELAVVDGKLAQFAQVDWARLWESDPVEAGKLRILKDELKESRDRLASQLGAKHQEFQQAQQQHLREVIARGSEILRRDIKGWSQELAQSVRSHAASYGFSEAELATVVDPRMVRLMHDAYQFRAIKQSNIESKRVMPSAQRGLKPGQPAASQANSARTEAAKTAFRKSGRIEDGAAFLLAKGLL